MFNRFFFYLSSLFEKDKERAKAKHRRSEQKPQHGRSEQAPSQYFTPRRVPTPINFRNGDIPLRRVLSYSDDVSKQPRITGPSIPVARNSSHSSLMKFASEESAPFGKQDTVRKLESGYHTHFPLKSKIPIPQRNLVKFTAQQDSLRRQRGQHTLPINRVCYKNDDTLNNEDADIRSPVIGTWVEFRTDTNKKFECVFKFLSKQKHATGKLLDAAAHSQWMQVSGIEVDLDGKMFNDFARGRDSLNSGEYKFLIDRICSVHELDYWSVLRQMATFQQQEIYNL